MDRTPVNQDNGFQVSLEEVITELNKQIASLNFELTVSKIAIQKLQNALQNGLDHTHDHGHETSKINTETF